MLRRKDLSCLPHHVSCLPRLVSTILGEWSQIDERDLFATHGEFDKAVALIAERTGYTKALARRQLEEIYEAVPRPSRPQGSISRPSDRSRKAFFLAVVSGFGLGFLAGALYRFIRMKK